MKNEDSEKQKVRDLRNCTFHWIDNQIFDNYLKLIGKTSYLVYCVYARHANNATQQSWPSNVGIAKALGVNETTVRRCQQKLVDCGLMKIKPRKGKTSIYTLLTPKDDPVQISTPCAGARSTPCAGARRTKTYIKRTKKQHCHPKMGDSKTTPSPFDGKASERLYKIIKSHINININTSKWPDIFRRLRTVDKISKARIKDVLNWYKSNIGDKYTPVAHSAVSFRDKFTRLESAMFRYNKKHYGSDDEDDGGEPVLTYRMGGDGEMGYYDDN